MNGLFFNVRLAVLALLVLMARDMMSAPGFYVWQRDVTPAVLAAARAATDEGREIFALAGEFAADATGALSDLTPGMCPPFNFGSGDSSLPFATAVFRIRPDALDAPKTFGAALAARAGELGATFVQLDVDAPESRLADYALLASAVRDGLPKGATLSLTLLPCHFAHLSSVRAVLAFADYGVLQLHGVDPPGSLSDEWRLMNSATIRSALSRARSLDVPLRMALPAYAYVLTFDADGSFRRLYAEGFPGRQFLPDDMVYRLAAPDMAILSELLSAPDAMPAIWFRLPVPGGDRWCLDRKTLSEIEAGRIPESGVHLETETLPAGNGFRLFATFRHTIPFDPVKVPLHWRDADRDGEWIAVGGCVADVPGGGLPQSVALAPHACGERFLAAVVLAENRLHPSCLDHHLSQP